MFQTGLKAELWRCISIITVFGIIGLFLGHFTIMLACGLACCLAWIFFNLFKLENWVNHTRRDILNSNHELKGIGFDISYDVQLMLSRHQKERLRLKAIINRIQTMASSLTDAVILIDSKGNIEWWNTSAEQLLDFQHIDHGHKLTNFIRHPRFIKYYEKQVFDKPLELTLRGDEQHLKFQIYTFGQNERLIFVRDITRLFKLKQMRKDFVANVSHELRTPLTVIQGYLETLADSKEAPPKWAKPLQQMEQQSHRMSLLINDLIILTKLETSQKEDTPPLVPIHKLVVGIIADAIAISGDKHHQFCITGDKTLAIIGSERELRSAISNLVVNAVNYSQAKAKIYIECEFLNNEAVIRVRDTGIGIDPKHLPRITERFYRVDADRSVATGGTGLGLAIVKHVLVRHNAELKVSSKIGKGSEFACHFPISLTRSVDAPE